MDGILDTRNYIDIVRDHLFESELHLGIREHLPVLQQFQTYDTNNKRVFVM